MGSNVLQATKALIYPGNDKICNDHNKKNIAPSGHVSEQVHGYAAPCEAEYEPTIHNERRSGDVNVFFGTIGEGIRSSENHLLDKQLDKLNLQGRMSLWRKNASHVKSRSYLLMRRR